MLLLKTLCILFVNGNAMHHDVVTIGAATRDVFLISNAFQLIASPKFSTGVGECVALGSKIDLEDAILTTGGGATNCAVTFAHLGFNTATVARIGQDDAAESIINDLQKHGVQTDLLRRVAKGRTAYSTLLTAKNGERSVLVFRGVSANFEKRDIPLSATKARALYVTSLAGNLDVLRHILMQSRKNKTNVALNPGHGELQQAAKLLDLLRLVDVLIVNLEEAKQLLAMPQAAAVEAVRALSQFCGTVIVTDGPKGAYAMAGGITWFARPNNKKSISRTGAGDAFGSGAFAALLRGYTLDQALKVGMLNAESVIQQYGAKTGILRAWPSAKALSSVSVKKISAKS